jgi:uncharacterized protein
MRTVFVLLFVLTFAWGQDGPPAGRPSLRQRAEAGDGDAQFLLAKNYESGRSGLTKDFAQAAYWYRIPAEKGDPWAQASLGLLYRFGKGVALDLPEAYFWLGLAVSRTTGPDSESLAEYRDAVAAKLSAGQIEAGKKRIAAWSPKVK